jgi:hypothetical protein
MQFQKSANGELHLEFSIPDKKEVEVYIGDWFLCSVNIDDISKEAKEYLFNYEN